MKAIGVGRPYWWAEIGKPAEDPFAAGVYEDDNDLPPEEPVEESAWVERSDDAEPEYY